MLTLRSFLLKWLTMHFFKGQTEASVQSKVLGFCANPSSPPPNSEINCLIGLLNLSKTL